MDMTVYGNERANYPMEIFFLVPPRKVNIELSKLGEALQARCSTEGAHPEPKIELFVRTGEDEKYERTNFGI